MPEQPRTIPNFEGKITFLAYLMHKGYVTEADAPRGDTVPFTETMFKFAQTRRLELGL